MYAFLEWRNTAVALFVCRGLTSFLIIWGHIATMPTCSSDSLTNVLPHRNAMPQTQDMTPHPVTVYRQRANLACRLLPIDVDTQLPILTSWVGPNREILLRPSTHQLMLNFMMLVWWQSVRSLVESVTHSLGLELETCGVRIH